jgi:transcriptional regulator with XRE-family HTH domain
MEDQRIGRVLRALRRRRGWRQVDLANAAGYTQSTISLLERGHLEHVSLSVVRRVMLEIEATLTLDVRWQGAALDRLLDEDHAVVVANVINVLTTLGWETRVEVTYSEYGERGSYDILAWHAGTHSLLVIEVKTDLPSAEATVRKLDEKTRLAPKVARETFGWTARNIGRVLVMPEDSTLRRRVHRHRTYFATVLPSRGAAVRAWVREPSGRLDGLWFLSVSDAGTAIRRSGGRSRVRVARQLPANEVAAA